MERRVRHPKEGHWASRNGSCHSEGVIRVAGLASRLTVRTPRPTTVAGRGMLGEGLHVKGWLLVQDLDPGVPTFHSPPDLKIFFIIPELHDIYYRVFNIYVYDNLYIMIIK